MTNNKIRIMWQSDSLFLPTGYAKVSREILTRLNKDPDFEVIAVATNAFQGIPLKSAVLEDGMELNFTLLPQGRGSYNEDITIPYIKKFKPHIVCFLQDSFMHMNTITKMDFPCKTIFYYPSDGEPFPMGCDTVLRKVTVPVAMAKFGQEQVKRQYNIDSEYIPHAVNTEEFFPITDQTKEQLRSKRNVLITDSNLNLIWFKDFMKGKFVVFSAFRNQGRKMPDRQIKAWAKFAEGKEDVCMICHTDPLDNTAVFDIRVLINSLKINNSVCFTGMQFHTPFTQQELNEVYNCGNIYMQSTCFTPDTLVNTSKGVKEIIDIKINDKVLTSSGEYRSVLNTIKEDYEGEILKIKAFGIPEFKCTPNHKIYCVKCGSSNRKKKVLKEGTPLIELVRADNIHNMDYLVFPLPNTDVKYSCIKTDKYLETDRQVNHIMNENIPEKINLNYDFGRFCGIYLADGCIHNDGPLFTINKEKTEYHKVVEDFVNNVINKNYNSSIKKMIKRISVYCKWLGRLMSDLFGTHCHNKKLPEWVLNSPKDFKQGLIEGLFRCDGCRWISKSKYPVYELQMVSKQLINQINILLISEGFKPSLSVRKNLKNCIIHGVEYERRDVWSITINGNQGFGNFIKFKDVVSNKPSSKIYKDENYIYYPVSKILKEKYNGKVYDLTVDKEHNYVCHCLVKNSGEGFGLCTGESMSCELPVIITDCTTSKELVTDHNAGITVPVDTTITGTWNVERFLMDIDKGVEALEFYYNDWKNNESKIIKEHGCNGREACKKFYEWDIVVEDWKKLFKRMME